MRRPIMKPSQRLRALAEANGYRNQAPKVDEFDAFMAWADRLISSVIADLQR